MNYQQQQSHHAGPSSSVPGASGGRGDPGPSSMAQQGQQFRSQQGINPQQVAMLQQMAQARGQQGGQNPQWTPQQLQMAMSEMQAQGGNVNTQALIQAAMRASGGQVMTPTPQGNRTPDQMGQTGGGGQDAHGQAPAMQQQRMQHLMQQQGGAPSPQQREAMQGRTATPSISASTRPSQQPSQQSGNMPPPPKPGSGIQNGQINYSQPQPAANQQLSLTPQQQQFFAAQRAQMIANPQFQQLQPQQQHQQLAFMTQHMIRTFAQQNAPGQQQQQQQQQQQRQQQQQLQYSQANAQPFPGGSGQQQHLQQAAGQPLSSLPQHMAPPRPASAASQRAPSSHDSSPSMYHTASTPPQPIYPTATPQHQSMPSLTTSTHSHQSHQHQTPRQQSIPPPNSSSPVSQPHTSQRGQPPQAIGVNGTLSQQPNAKAPFALQAMQQHAQNAQTMLQSGQLTGPPQVDAQNVAAQKQQQVASSIGFMTGTAGNQAVMLNAGQGMPPRPPMPNINMSDFPFDWRLLPQISHLNDPKWQSEVQQRNPQLLAAVQSAAAMLNSGSVRQDVLQRMQQVLFHAARSQAAARPPQQVGQVSQQVQQQLAATGMPGYSQNGQLSQQQIQALPPAQQQRLWAMQQAQGYGGGRPPPPHLPPSLLPESPSNGTVPSAARRLSISNDAMPRERTPSHASMPPPAWIPSHGFARPPPHTAPDAPSSHSPSPHAVPVKLWESALRLDLPITNISPLPTNDIDESADSTFGGLLMPMSDQEKEQVQEWLQRDKGFAKEMEDHKRKMQKKWMKWAQNNDMDTPWWQVRKGEQYRQPVGRLSIIWPSDKANLRARSTHRGRKEFRFSPAQLKAMANVEDHIVPVRLEVEHDHWKLKDTFLWNCADTVVTPEMFAQTMCDDFNVPVHQFGPKIVAAIIERVREYQDQVLPILQRNADACRGKLDSDGEAMAVFRRARDGSEEIKTESGHEDDSHVKIVGIDVDDDEAVPMEERPMTVEEATNYLPPEQEEDLRILIKVDIIVATQNLSDTFEWDLNSDVSPEEFALSYIKELGLSGEFATALSHDIHEQILIHQRSLFLVGHTPGFGIILDDEVRSAFLAPLSDTSVLRREETAMSSFTPIFATFTEEDIAHLEKERDKDLKRKKRATRARRGIILPDREPQKTHRTLVNPVGPNGLMPAQVEPTAAPINTGRRAAAMAAQANINLLAQDLPIPQPPSPIPLPAPNRARKRGRGNSRMSPTPGREGSVGNPDTPMTGMKRSYREDSVSETASPLPARRRNGGRIMSPEDEPVQPFAQVDLKRKSEGADEGRVGKSIKSEAPPANGSAGWHCRNCGVPEHLSGGIRKDPAGRRSLCGTCARYQTRTGKKRPCDYIEDDEYHRQRIESGRRTRSPPPESAASPSTVNSNLEAKDNGFQATSSSKASTSSDSSAESPRPRSSDDTKVSVTPAKTALEPPQWMLRVNDELRSKYARDDFAVVQRPKPAEQPEAEPEWRMKCMDCPGRIYQLGPGESLQNFEVHLKNRAHIANRQARETKGIRTA